MGRRRRLSVAEAATLALLAVWSIGPLALILRHAGASGDVFTGADGAFAADQLQYLSWIREAGEHVLAANAFDLGPSAEVFLHPMFVLSGALWKLGLGVQASYLAWKPVAVLVLFAGFALFVRRTVAGSGARAAALVLALFYVPCTAALLDWTTTGSVEIRTQLGDLLGEAFPAGQLWGYLPTAIAVGAMPLYVLAAERGLREEGARRRTALAAAALAGLVASWLHPWQGQVLVLVTLGLLAWGRLRRPTLPLLVPLAATLLPLLYYGALSELDAAWEIARRQNEEPRADAWIVVAAIAPLLPLAAVGAPRRPSDPVARALLLLPVAMLVTYAVLSPSVPGHALEGISLPLAVMTVRGWQALRWPAAVGAFAMVALILPGAVYSADRMRDAVEAEGQPHYLRPGEARAMDELERDRRPGGVIADPRLAPAVPAHTGRAVWAGHPSWTPAFPERIRAVDELFSGGLDRRGTADLLRRSGARFALAGCLSSPELRRSTATAVASVRRFGCATIYELKNAP